MAINATRLIRPAFRTVTQIFQGDSPALTYSFSPDMGLKPKNHAELALLRLDAELELDLQHNFGPNPSDVEIERFEALSSADPVTGKTNLIIGRALPGETSWTIQWAANSLFPTDEILVHEWGHVLGLGHPDEQNPFSKEWDTADTVMSYNRNIDAPGKYYTETDLEALTLLWGTETSVPEERVPLSNSVDVVAAQSSVAAKLQQLTESDITNASFVQEVYSTLLKRDLDSGAAVHWNQALEQGLHRRGMIDTILLSDELLNLLQS